MPNKTVFNPLPKSGTAKLYLKNLVKALEELKDDNLLIKNSQFQNLLTQAYVCLLKLKKADPDFNVLELENEYNYYKEQFLKQYSK